MHFSQREEDTTEYWNLTHLLLSGRPMLKPEWLGCDQVPNAAGLEKLMVRSKYNGRFKGACITRFINLDIQPPIMFFHNIAFKTLNII